MKKAKEILKKVIVFVLACVFLISGLQVSYVYATEEKILSNENDNIEQLIMEKNHIKHILSEMEDSQEKEELQKEYNSLCQRLKSMGVNDHITEDLEYEIEDGISTYQTPAPDLSTIIGDNFDIDTFYQGGRYNGTNYILYKVIVTDKDGVLNKLSYYKPEMIILNGKVTDENALQKFIASSVKFATSQVAGIVASNPFVGAAVSLLIDLIPNYQSSYILQGGDNILNANSIVVEEAVTYIYGYDKDEDKWIHICSRNSAYVTYNLTLTYYDGLSFTNVTNVNNIIVTPDHGGKTNDGLAEYLVSRINDPIKYKILDYIGTSFTISLSNSSSVKGTFSLHGQANPYYMFSD